MPAVSAVEVNLAENRAKFVHDPEQSAVPALIAAVETASYSASAG